MKKMFLAAVAAVLVVVMSLAFFACGEKDGNGKGSGKVSSISYVDQDGKTVNVSVQETDSPEEVTEVLVAIAEQDNQQAVVRSLLANVQATIAGSVTAGDVTQHVDLTAVLGAGLNIPTVDDNSTVASLLNAAAPYLSLSLRGNMPLDDEGNADLSNIIKLDESVQLYYANSTLYAKATLSNDMKARIGATDADIAEAGEEDDEWDGSDYDYLDDYYGDNSDIGFELPDYTGGAGFDINTLLDGYVKLSLGDMLDGLTGDVDMAEIKEILDKIAQNNPIDVMVSLSGEEQEQGKSDRDLIKEWVEKLGVAITSTANGKITFRATLTKESALSLVAELGEMSGDMIPVDMKTITKALATYDGTSYLSVAFDAQSMRFVGLEIEAKALLNCLLSSDVVEMNEKVVLDTATIKVDLQYNQTIPTIAASDAANAKDVSSLLYMLFGMLM